MMIYPMLALAGIAEMMLGAQIKAAIITLCLVPIILVVTMVTRSRIIGIFGLVVCIVPALLCEPWYLFMQKEFEDPDMTYWAAHLRTASWWWLLVVALFVPAFVLVLRRNWNHGQMKNRTPNQALHATSEPAPRP